MGVVSSELVFNFIAEQQKLHSEKVLLDCVVESESAKQKNNMATW